MRTVKYAGIQMSCTGSVQENIEKAERLVRKAAADGAQIILLPELFENWYFCQERNYESYKLAKPLMENDAVLHFQRVAKELSVVPFSFCLPAGLIIKLVIKFKLHSVVHNGRISYKIL